jgi:predicted flap endonuclease-1-like 5' DNA nuclease
MDTDDSEFPPGLGKVARRELAVHGVTQYARLPDYTAEELLALHGIGPKAIRILREELTARGLAFRGE